MPRRLAFWATTPRSGPGWWSWAPWRRCCRRPPAGWVLNGHKAVVPFGAQARGWLVSARLSGAVRDPAGLALLWVPRETPGVHLRDVRRADGGRAAELALPAVRLAPEALVAGPARAAEGLAWGLDVGTLALCAEALGVMETAFEHTRQYLQTRHQFGRPIGSFQALQHRMVEWIALAQTRLAVLKAAAALAEPDARVRARALSAAQVTVGRQGTHLAEEAIQLHGDMGLTWELPLAHDAKQPPARGAGLTAPSGPPRNLGRAPRSRTVMHTRPPPCSEAPRRWRALGRWVAVGVVALAAAGCSVIGLTYNRLPTVVMLRLDSFWDLDASQRQGLEEAARRWHQWHRREQLPLIADLLRRWQTLVAGPLDAETVCREADTVRALLRQATDRTVDDLARWLPTLTDAQLAHWRERLVAADRDWLRDWGESDIDRGVRLSRARQLLEMFYGRLDEDQRRWLRARLMAMDPRPDLAWAERQRRQNDWMDTARRLRGLAPEAAVAEVRALWARTWQSPDPALAAHQASVWRHGCAWLADWHAQASPQQRARAASQLQAYERDIRALISHGGAPGVVQPRAAAWP